MLILRPISHKDREVLRLATFYNLNWNKDRFSLKDIDLNPQFSHYYDTWNPHDFGFIAQRYLQIFGVVWLKYFTANDPGYGFVSDEIPELSISVFPEYRNSGFGKKLLKYAIEEAKSLTISAISLSVEIDNPARSLYLSFGFTPVNPQNDNGTMILEL